MLIHVDSEKSLQTRYWGNLSWWPILFEMRGRQLLSMASRTVLGLESKRDGYNNILDLARYSRTVSLGRRGMMVLLGISLK